MRKGNTTPRLGEGFISTSDRERLFSPYSKARRKGREPVIRSEPVGTFRGGKGFDQCNPLGG